MPLHSGAGARAAAAASGAFNVLPLGARGGAARTASSASDPGGGGGGYGGAGDVRAFNNVMAWHRRTSLDNSALERPDMPEPGCAACGCARGRAVANARRLRAKYCDLRLWLVHAARWRAATCAAAA